MKLVTDVEVKPLEAEIDIKENPEPAVDLLPITLATMLPGGMVESLKAIRHEIGVIHASIVNNHGMVPSYLGGAYTAIEDAESFLKQIANGKEEFTPVPKKPVVHEADKPTTDNTIKVPNNLNDIPYMQEWAGTCFFPTLRGLTVRKDVEVDIRADKIKKKIHLIISVTLPNEPAFILPFRFKANYVVNLFALAKSIDAL